MRDWLLFVALYLATLALVVGLTEAYPGDEQHFIDTSRLFAQGITADLIRAYPEMSGPLPFAVFGGWGRLFGFSLPGMRACSLLIAALALIAAYRLIGDFHAAALLGLNPYWAAMSIFVYTDMLAVLFAVLAFDAARRERPLPFALAATAALLCRQYLIFLPLAVVLYGGAQRQWRMVAAALVSAIPLAVLVLHWGGLAPDSPVRDQYLARGFAFHLSALFGYIGLLFLFSLPWLVMVRPRLPLWPALGAVVYWLAPLRPSPASVAAGIPTMGLADRVLHMAVPQETARDVFYMLLLAGGLCLLAARRRFPLATVAIAAFLVVMPFSYLYWEKYLLPLVPIAAVAAMSMAPQPRPPATTSPVPESPESPPSSL